MKSSHDLARGPLAKSINVPLTPTKSPKVKKRKPRTTPKSIGASELKNISRSKQVKESTSLKKRKKRKYTKRKKEKTTSEQVVHEQVTFGTPKRTLHFSQVSPERG